jgi:hypothetical protein
MRHTWAIIAALSLTAIGCEPGEGIEVTNSMDVPVVVRLNLPPPGSRREMHLDPGQRSSSYTITSKPGTEPLTVRAFDANGESIFCRVYQPGDMNVTASGYRTWVIVITEGDSSCQ